MAAYRILFDAFHLYHLPQFDPVIDLLTEDTRFDVSVTTSPLNRPEEIGLTLDVFNSRNFKVIFDQDNDKLQKLIKRWDPHVYICGWSRYSVDQMIPPHTLAGMIYHGIGVKPSYWRDNHPRVDLRFVEGASRKKQLIEKGIKTDLVLTGFSKLDPIFNGHVPSREKTLTELGLDPKKKTILFAPTFYPSSFEVYGKNLVKYTEGYNLIIKLHMWVYFMEQFGAVKLKRQRILVEKLKNRSENVAIVDPHYYNIIPLYEAADVLVTEASSTIYEMLAIGKPVIVASFYKLYMSHRIFRYRLYRKRLDEQMTRDIARFCYTIKKPRELEAALKKVFDNGYRPDPSLKDWIYNWLYKLDGRASERIRDAILARVAQRENQSE